MQLPLTLVRNGLLIGRHTVISFNRTLRIPEDGKRYDLPAGFGRLPILRVEDVADRVPEKWRQEGGLIIPLYQREALFLEFSGVEWRPTVAKVAVGRVNAITGKPHDLDLKKGRQDYVVIPVQKWLDGINSGNGVVRQFVAMPLGQGYTVEAQITDEEAHGGFQLAVFDPKPGRFSEPKTEERESPTEEYDSVASIGEEILPFEMGVAAGGSIKQQIFEDTFGIDTWDHSTCVSLNIHIVNSEVYSSITGKTALPSPITAEVYAKSAIPWFEHYDETKRSVAAPTTFNRILSVFQIDEARGKVQPVVASATTKASSVVRVSTLTLTERVGELRKDMLNSYREKNYAECIAFASKCGELIGLNKDELMVQCLSARVEEEAAECFCLASECAARIEDMEISEDYANKALLLSVSKKAFFCRLFARFQSGNIDGAIEDNEELRGLTRKDELYHRISRLIGSLTVVADDKEPCKNGSIKESVGKSEPV